MNSARQPQPPPARLPAFRRLLPVLVAVATTFALLVFAAAPRAGAQEETTQPATGDTEATAPENSPEETGDEGSSEEGGSYSQRELELVELINDYRAKKDREPLEVSKTASAAAEHHSSDMAEYDYFGHDTEKSDYYDEGATFEDRLEKEGYDRDTSRGENIASGNEDAEATFEQWKDSPEHDANMLREEFKAVGVGVACSEESSSGCYWTTDFGGYADESAQKAEDLSARDEEGDASEGKAGGDTNASSTDAPQPDDSTDNSTDDSTDNPTDKSTDGPGSDSGDDTTGDHSSDQYDKQDGGDPSSDQYNKEDGSGPTSDQYDKEDGGGPGGPPAGPAGQQEKDCDLLGGFDVSPLEPGYSDALQKEIHQFTTCVQNDVMNSVNQASGSGSGGSGGGGTVQSTTIDSGQTSGGEVTTMNGDTTYNGGGAAGGGGVLPEEADPGTEGLLEDFLGSGSPGSGKGDSGKGGSGKGGHPGRHKPAPPTSGEGTTGAAPGEDTTGGGPGAGRPDEGDDGKGSPGRDGGCKPGEIAPPEDTDCDGMPDSPGPDSPGGGPPNNEPGCQPNEEAAMPDSDDCAGNGESGGGSDNGGGSADKPSGSCASYKDGMRGCDAPGPPKFSGDDPENSGDSENSGKGSGGES